MPLCTPCAPGTAAARAGQHQHPSYSARALVEAWGLEIVRNTVLVQLALQPWWSKAFLPGKIFLVKGVLWLKYEEGWKQSLQGEKYGYCARIDRGNLHVSELFFTQNIPAS